MPGYYGTNSTKWLTSLTVSDRRSAGAFTTTYYMDPPEDGTRTATPVWALAPNSCLVAPAEVAERVDRAWQKFSLIWTPAAVGEHVLACRATTRSGATQPATPRRNRIHQRVVFVTLGEPR